MKNMPSCKIIRIKHVTFGSHILGHMCENGLQIVKYGGEHFFLAVVLGWL